MNTFLTISTILANVISLVAVYQFIKKLDKKQIVIFMAVSVGIMYILVLATYWISGFGVNKEIHEASKNLVLYLFVPVNVILFVPYIASRYMKLKESEIKNSDFTKKIEVVVILLIIVLVLEFFYFRSIQTNIANIQERTNTIENAVNGDGSRK